MEVLKHTDDHQATLMRDVFEALEGKEVIVWLDGCHTPLGGKLEKYNGQILQLTSPHATKNTYIPVGVVVAISSDE